MRTYLAIELIAWGVVLAILATSCTVPQSPAVQAHAAMSASQQGQSDSSAMAQAFWGRKP